MELEQYFEFITEDTIRIKGTRIGIETILEDYRLGATPDEIVIRYPTLSLQQVYATITYYLENVPAMEAYLEQMRRRREKAWQEQERHPSDFVRSLRERLQRQRQVLAEEGVRYDQAGTEK